MFLPALLVRDYGRWAWLVFALPNVVGAAAMGWVLRSRNASEEVTSTHVGACRAFSVVTIAFHLYFAAWYLPRLIGDSACVGIAVLALLAVGPVPLAKRWTVAAAVLSWLASLAAFGLLFATDTLDRPIDVPAFRGAWPGLSIICLVGFVACPYFDLTFHQARRDTNGDGAKIAFGIGFGVVFCSMIVFTLAYAGLILAPTPAWPTRLIGAHVLWQSAVTVWYHRRALEESRGGAAGRNRVAWAAYAAALAVGALGAAWAGRVQYAGLEAGEIGYRFFLGFYALIFPGYAWLCLLARRSDRKAVGVLIVAVLIALPFFWLAFIERQANWSVGGIAVVLLARILVKTNPRPTVVMPMNV